MNTYRLCCFPLWKNPLFWPHPSLQSWSLSICRWWAGEIDTFFFLFGTKLGTPSNKIKLPKLDQGPRDLDSWIWTLGLGLPKYSILLPGSIYYRITWPKFWLTPLWYPHTTTILFWKLWCLIFEMSQLRMSQKPHRSPSQILPPKW